MSDVFFYFWLADICESFKVVAFFTIMVMTPLFFFLMNENFLESRVSKINYLGIAGFLVLSLIFLPSASTVKVIAADRTQKNAER